MRDSSSALNCCCMFFCRMHYVAEALRGAVRSHGMKTLNIFYFVLKLRFNLIATRSHMADTMVRRPSCSVCLRSDEVSESRTLKQHTTSRTRQNVRGESSAATTNASKRCKILHECPTRNTAVYVAIRRLYLRKLQHRLAQTQRHNSLAANVRERVFERQENVFFPPRIRARSKWRPLHYG